MAPHSGVEPDNLSLEDSDAHPARGAYGFRFQNPKTFIAD